MAMKGKFNPGSKFKQGSKFKPGGKKRQNKCVVMFDDKERQEFLTGFHKRKVERRKAAVDEIKNKIKEEQKRVKVDRQKEYMKMLKERKEALDDADELEDVITGTTESVQFDHPNHTVTVTTISDLDLTGGRLLEPAANQKAEEDGENGENGGEEKNEENGGEEEQNTLPKKAGNPILSKKIQSLTASLHARTQKKKKKWNGKQEGRGRGQQTERKSVDPDNKRRLGRTTKKQRRKRTGRRGRHQD